MKIELSKRISVEFQDLMDGDIFTCDGMFYYMKIEDVLDLNGKILCNCVRITDGELGLMTDEIKVRQIEDAKVIVYEC